MSDPLPVYAASYPVLYQQHDWDCSEESCHWMLGAYGRTPDEQWLESALVSDGVINPAVGLNDATGAGLADWLNREYAEFGYVASNVSLVAFDEVAREAGEGKHPLMIGGRRWYHWSAVRGYDPLTGVLRLANPAPNYLGINQSMSAAQFQALGDFSLVRLTHPGAEGTAPATVCEGIDTSSHQGHVDYAAVARTGIGFVFAKATEGLSYCNPEFGRAWHDIAASGMLRGAYHYARPESGYRAVDEAGYFVAMVGSLADGDIVVLDLEPTVYVEGLADWALAWLHEVEARTGARPFVYTGQWVVDQQGLATATALGRYPLWLAAYQAEPPAAPRPWSAITVWQYTSHGAVDGVSTPVDLNRFYGTREQLAAYGLSDQESIVPETQPSYDDLNTLVGVAYNRDGSVRLGLETAKQAPDVDSMRIEIQNVINFLAANCPNPDKA